jgi:hypothetical protein
LLEHRKKIAKFLMRTFIYLSTFLYGLKLKKYSRRIFKFEKKHVSFHENGAVDGQEH